MPRLGQRRCRTGGACRAGCPRCGGHGGQPDGKLDRKQAGKRPHPTGPEAGRDVSSGSISQENKPQSFQGSYTVADNLLILKQDANPMMVGQVTPLADGGFNFKLAGGSSSDPGLTFSR